MNDELRIAFTKQYSSFKGSISSTNTMMSNNLHHNYLFCLATLFSPLHCKGLVSPATTWQGILASLLATRVFRKNKVLNLDHLDFDIVSNFVLRISCFSYRDTLHDSRNCPLHLSRELYKSTLFMQNKAKFSRARMNITPILTREYGNIMLCGSRKNKAKQTQNTCLDEAQRRRKPNSNPICAL